MFVRGQSARSFNGRGGRAKGTPNKTTATVRSILTQAFEGTGGLIAFIEWGKENRGEFYKLWAKMLPTQITGEDGGPIRFTREELAGLSIEQLVAMLAIQDRIDCEAIGDGVPSEAGS